MYKKVEKEAVSPVIAVILMVAITVVLAAVLFVMVQQYTEEQPGGLEAMSFTTKENTAGWLVTIAKGDIENTSAVEYYVLNTTSGGREPGVTITWNDNQGATGNNHLDSGDTFTIVDATHSFRSFKFVISTGDSTVEATLRS